MFCKVIFGVGSSTVSVRQYDTRGSISDFKCEVVRRQYTSICSMILIVIAFIRPPPIAENAQIIDTPVPLPLPINLTIYKNIDSSSRPQILMIDEKCKKRRNNEKNRYEENRYEEDLSRRNE